MSRATALRLEGSDVRWLRILVVALSVIAIGAACSDDAGKDNAKAKTSANKKAKKASEEAVMQADLEYHYDPEGKPDPFESYVKQLVSMNQGVELTSPLQRFDLSQLTVTGIIWSAVAPRALIQDPTGKGYVVQTGAAIGKNRGRIVGIEDNRLIVKETYVDFEDRATTKEVDMYLYERNGG
jgi:type IV pilus assembly protein PilP